MISTNDTSILAMFSRYPDINDTEANAYLDRLEHYENIEVGKALLGRISKDELSNDARQTYEEMNRWSRNKTLRVRNEQVSARQRGNSTVTATRMKELHRKGVISDETLVMYGISGDLPDRQQYENMTTEERAEFFHSRWVERFGPEYQPFEPIVIRSFIRYISKKAEVNWLKEGF